VQGFCSCLQKDGRLEAAPCINRALEAISIRAGILRQCTSGENRRNGALSNKRTGLVSGCGWARRRRHDIRSLRCLGKFSTIVVSFSSRKPTNPLQQHSGGMGGGHYTAHALNARNGKWYSFNDSYCSESREGDCVGRSAYVLFYRKRQPGTVLAPLPAPMPGEPTQQDSDDDMAY
jgi:hypothetical protein